MSDDSKIAFQDAIQPREVNIDKEYTAPIKYEEHPNEEAYGSIGDRGIELEYSTAADSVETLHAKKHLAAQLHERNRAEWTDVDEPNDGSTLYDLTILDVIEPTLEEESLNTPESAVFARRLSIAFLEEARCVTNRSQYYRHLKDRPRVCEALGYESPDDLPSYDTIRDIRSNVLPQIFEDIDSFEEAFRHAAVRAVYAAYRNGVVPPEAVQEEFELDALTPKFSESTINRVEKREALRNWIRLLKEETLGPLTFGRENPQFDTFDLIGLLATSALIDGGLETAAEVALWDHDYENVPKGTGLPKYIANRLPDNRQFNKPSNEDAPTVKEQFNAVHEQVLTLAEEMGFFPDPVRVAVDIHEIEWTGGEAPTISRWNKRMNDVTEEWTFVIASIIDNKNRLTLGVRLLRKKSEYPSKVREILSGTADHFDIQTLVADADMVPGELISVFRSFANDDWIIKAPDRDAVKVLKGFTPREYAGYAERVKAGVSSKPNLLAIPENGTDPSLITIEAAEIENPAIDEDDIEKYKDPPEKEGKTHVLGEWAENSESRPSATSSPKEDFPIPSLLEEFSDPASMTGVGAITSHAAYFTDRTFPVRSPTGVRSDYLQRWAAEESINQISNDFMPGLGGANPDIRLYGINVAALLQNWHTIINRARSPKRGYRLDVTHSEVLKAIQHVAFA